MAKIEPKWASTKFVSVEPKAENSGNFSIEAGRVHVVADGQGPILANLPAASNGLNLFVKALVTDIDTDTISIVPQGGALIDGIAGSYLMNADNQSLHLVSDGVDWYII